MVPALFFFSTDGNACLAVKSITPIRRRRCPRFVLQFVDDPDRIGTLAHRTGGGENGLHRVHRVLVGSELCRARVEPILHDVGVTEHIHVALYLYRAELADFADVISAQIHQLLCCALRVLIRACSSALSSSGVLPRGLSTRQREGVERAVGRMTIASPRRRKRSECHRWKSRTYKGRG